MIDELAWIFRLKPSFVMLFPDEKALTSPGDKTNTTILYPKYADQDLEFNVLSSGRAKLKTYFLGEPKEGRLFDIYFRFFETGFRLTNFTGLEDSIFKLTNKTELSISSEDYKHPSFVTGKTKQFKVNGRIQRYS